MHGGPVDEWESLHGSVRGAGKMRGLSHGEAAGAVAASCGRSTAVYNRPFPFQRDLNPMPVSRTFFRNADAGRGRRAFRPGAGIMAALSACSCAHAADARCKAMTPSAHCAGPSVEP
jgi:hypothetical protein